MTNEELAELERRVNNPTLPMLGLSKSQARSLIATAREAEALREENARLKGKVRAAFNEGYDAGQESALPDGPIAWMDNREAEWANFAHAALEQGEVK